MYPSKYLTLAATFDIGLSFEAIRLNAEQIAENINVALNVKNLAKCTTDAQKKGPNQASTDLRTCARRKDKLPEHVVHVRRERTTPSKQTEQSIWILMRSRPHSISYRKLHQQHHCNVHQHEIQEHSNPAKCEKSPAAVYSTDSESGN